MENKETPPDEKDWKEMKEFFEEKFLGDIPFYRMRTYVHDKKDDEGLLTVDFLESGVILKCHGIKFPDRVDKYFYLLLSDGCWVKGLANMVYKIEAEPEIRDGEKFIRLTVMVQTKNGPRRRILRKKIGNKK